MPRRAQECGLATAESRIETVGGKNVLFVKHFDHAEAEKIVNDRRLKWTPAAT